VIDVNHTRVQEGGIRISFVYMGKLVVHPFHGAVRRRLLFVVKVNFIFLKICSAHSIPFSQ